MSIAESFGRSSFAKFVNTPAGRLVRVVVGIALIALGYTSRGSTMGIILMVVGLVPLTAGAFNLCLISALLGGPISGARVGGGIQSHDSKPTQQP
ncbi:MAG: DUF2892 domain-containing protein [Gemmatimonadales bacterium]|jgi:hypothetical protein